MASDPAPGQLRNRIVIEAVQGETRDAYNATIQTWCATDIRWAKIVNKRPDALQISQADTRAMLGTMEITIRHCPRLTVLSRIRWGLTLEEAGQPGPPPRYFKIIGIEDKDNRHIWQVITAVEVTA